MGNERVKEYLTKHNHKLISFKQISLETEDFGASTNDPGMLNGSKINSRQRFLIRSATHYLAEKKHQSVSSINSSLRKFLDLRTLDEMESAQFSKAVDFLISQE